MDIAVSSWALHRAIGVAYWNAPGNDVFEEKIHRAGGVPISDLAKVIADYGFRRLELCHFHLKNRERSYLEEVATALNQAGLTLQTLLIDDGNLTDPQNGERDRDWIKSWIEAAQVLDAEAVRVIAGKNVWTEETFGASRRHLQDLSNIGVRIRIENWFDLLQTPNHVNRLLDDLGGRVGLCVDFGNWSHPEKYRDLELIAGRAETAHAKAEFIEPEVLDTNDYATCLSLCARAGFSGPFVLVNGGSLPGEWEALVIQRDFIVQHAKTRSH